MNHNLRYDICGISDLSLIISDMDGLDGRIDANIPAALPYACRHFANHLHDIATPVPALREYSLPKVCCTGLRLVIGILDELANAEGCLRIIASYIKVNPCIAVSIRKADLLLEGYNVRK